MKDLIDFEDFEKIDLRVGYIEATDFIEGSNKLIKLTVNFGEEGTRTVLAGLRKAYPDPDILVGLSFVFCINLKPRTMFGQESQGMILCASTGKEQPKIPHGSLFPLTPVIIYRDSPEQVACADKDNKICAGAEIH